MATVRDNSRSKLEGGRRNLNDGRRKLALRRPACACISSQPIYVSSARAGRAEMGQKACVETAREDHAEAIERIRLIRTYGAGARSHKGNHVVPEYREAPSKNPLRMV